MKFLPTGLWICYKGQKMKQVLPGLIITEFQELPCYKNGWLSLCTSHLSHTCHCFLIPLLFHPPYVTPIKKNPDFRTADMGKGSRQGFSRDCNHDTIHQPTLNHHFSLPLNHLVSPYAWCRS